MGVGASVGLTAGDVTVVAGCFVADFDFAGCEVETSGIAGTGVGVFVGTTGTTGFSCFGLRLPSGFAIVAEMIAGSTGAPGTVGVPVGARLAGAVYLPGPPERSAAKPSVLGLGCEVSADL